MNLKKKIDNPKFAYMNLNDSTVCTMTNTNYLLVPFSCICSYAIYQYESDCTNVHLLTRNWVYFSFQWKTWSEIFGGSRSGAGSYVVTYFIYMLWAIVFAMLAALFVRVFAPYACGSGIPEVSSPLLKEARWSNNLSSDLFLHFKSYIFVRYLSFL